MTLRDVFKKIDASSRRSKSFFVLQLTTFSFGSTRYTPNFSFTDESKFTVPPISKARFLEMTFEQGNKVNRVYLDLDNEVSISGNRILLYKSRRYESIYVLKCNQYELW